MNPNHGDGDDPERNDTSVAADGTRTDAPAVARRRFLTLASAGVAGAVLGAGSAGAGHGSGSDAGTTASPEELVAAMTLDEKIQLVHGHQGASTGYIPPIPRLGVPDVKMSDGPVGIRHREATTFPACIAQAATFDRDLLRRFGVAAAREAKAKDQDVWLAPGINIVRVPELGRAFEYYGEDPYLTAEAAVEVIEGAQANGVVTTAKHFAANNQEGQPVTAPGSDRVEGSSLSLLTYNSREYISAEVSERALREIYMPAFRAAIDDADVGSVMGAYNRVNGTYACESRRLLLDVLKDEWGFDGYVVSDWTASRPRSAPNGLDVEMPFGFFFDETLKRQVQTGVVDEETLDDKVLRLLRALDRTGALEGEKKGKPAAANTEDHQRLARRIAAEGAVLLKNDEPGLPLSLDAVDSIAVIGHEADVAKVGGGGSSDVTPPYTVSPLEAVRSYADGSASVEFERGRSATGPAADLAASSDVAIVFAQGSSTEGVDREDIVLDGNQNRLVADVAAANEHTVVVLNTGGPVTMPWVDDVPAVLEMWFPGMEDGNATVDVLFDEVTPGGKLPVTFGKDREQYPATEVREYPGVAGRVEYTEGVFVGYRYFDDRGNEPLFPFGHGLSYTEFDYRELEVTAGSDPAKVTVSATVENVGDRSGTEAPQLYIHDHQATVRRPPKELRGFEKVRLDPGESASVEFDLGEDDFAYFDDKDADDWVVDPGWFSVLVGSSSRDVRLVDSFQLTDGDGIVPLDATVTRSDDGSAFAGGQTNRIDLTVEATRPVRVRDRVPVDWDVVAGSPHEVSQVGDHRYVTFDRALMDDTLSYFVEAPAEPTDTGRSTFGPAAVSLDGRRWTAVDGTTDENAVVGIGSGAERWQDPEESSGGNGCDSAER